MECCCWWAARSGVYDGDAVLSVGGLWRSGAAAQGWGCVEQPVPRLCASEERVKL